MIFSPFLGCFWLSCRVVKKTLITSVIFVRQMIGLLFFCLLSRPVFLPSNSLSENIAETLVFFHFDGRQGRICVAFNDDKSKRIHYERP